MKPVIRKRVAGDRIAAALPPALRDRLPASARSPDSAFTLLLFPHAAEDVVRSGPVKKALARLPAGSPVVAAAGNFTEEALQALSDRGAIVLRVSDFHWTDERYARAREPLGLSPHRPTPKP